MSTIDPGIEDAIGQTSETVEARRESSKSGNENDEDDDGNACAMDEEREEEEEEQLMDPSRWWFASTACPLLAGTIGPIASGFNVCALVYNWRVFIPVMGTEEHGERIQDPPWLIAVNAVSLACAVIGNGSLLLNMGRRLRFSIAQPITITGFLSAGVLLIADLAAINASPTYYLTGADAPDARHALTSAYYYAIFAAVFYCLIGLLMCLTVYGANKGYYAREFRLTPSQRTLMLQTMAFIAYLLLGALVYSKLEGWAYLDAVYWADFTLLTVGIGDYAPATTVGRGLLFPFAIGGILIVGLVVGSIRSLVLERGKEKLSARIGEKRRAGAVQNVDARKQTIKISWLAKADFSTDPGLSPAQRREEEFTVMRKVQAAAERERRWLALFTSSTFALILWFAGAAVFMAAERNQEWTYFQSLYFTYVCLLTIGYGDLNPKSNAGRAFFVVWSLLAVPSLTILISNMGDTVVQWVSDATIWIGSITVLPGEQGFRATTKSLLEHILGLFRESVQKFTPPGIFGDAPEKGHSMKHEKRMPSTDHENRMMDRLADRLTSHIAKDERHEAEQRERGEDDLQRDIHFYHYVLARECRNLQKDLAASPAKQYAWQDWEYFLKLMGNEEEGSKGFPGQKHPDSLVPDALKMAPSTGSDATVTPETGAGMDGVTDRRGQLKEWKAVHDQHQHNFLPPPDQEPARKRHLTTMDVQAWSWLSRKSPLMGNRSETEWILDRLSAALERELNRQRKGERRKPPISMTDVRRQQAQARRQSGRGGKETGEIAGKEEENLGKAARSEA